ncbi:hypothetical protein GO986_21665 [Deinococcus sp. HMF7620]|uniref:BIG2 domain-containing protein n=1 Tax=Deinococcus arboris TaxID=2682977 RepID=A0A7C9IFD0_9DEIO|nr:Ig-like domain-containing protein [Deinococcus arboris]MVN89346.1 hypothetical protein [Deinococcus arboris]
MNPWWLGLTLLAAVPALGQLQPLPGKTPITVCPGLIQPAVSVTLKNERGQVLHHAGGSASQVTVQREGAGRYAVTVQRRWYQSVTVRGTHVLEDRCGPTRATPVTVHLRPVPGAPPIRAFIILGPTSGTSVIGFWPYFQRHRTFLDAPGSVSREVIWSSSDSAVATVDSAGMLRSVCSREVGWATITATLKAEPSVQASIRFSRGGGGMVCPRGAVDR